MPTSPLDLYIVTFNCGRTLLDVNAFEAGLFKPYKNKSSSSSSYPDIICLSLQEVAPLGYSFLGGSLLAPYFAPFVQAIQRAAGLKQDYRHVITHNVGMTAIMVLAKSEVSPNIQWIQTAEVGVGWSEAGNKGAAGVRLGYKSKNMTAAAPLTLVAAHLAPMEDAWQRRNEDWESIVRRLAFKSPTHNRNTASLSKASPQASKDAGEHEEDDEERPLLGAATADLALPTNPQVQGTYISGSPIFLAGDLNYRTSDIGPHPDHHHSFPQPVNDPNHALHWSRLLPQDQLNREQKAGRALQGLAEAKINFPPTYKLSEQQQESMTREQFLQDEDTSIKWLWSSHRFPSWCDRILYSTPMASSLKLLSYDAHPVQPTSDHRPVSLACSLDLERAARALADQAPPFPLLASWEGRRLAARRKELAIGIATYLSLTWEGNGLLLASLLGAVGGWWVLSSMVRP